MNLPVFFIHTGFKKHIYYAVKQADKYNREVILIGDPTNKNVTNRWYNINEYIDERLNIFEKVYKHMSNNNYNFEFFCFKRYFILYDFVKKYEIKQFMMLDSDLMSYIDFSTIDFDKYDVGYYMVNQSDINYNWAISPHCSYWTSEALNDFIDFIITVYKDEINKLEEKWDYHKKNNLSGGICDMTLLYLWNEKKRWNAYNTGFVNSLKGVFDSFISSGIINDQKYIMNPLFNIKRIHFIHNIPYFCNEMEKKVQAYTIHAQGRRKMFIRNFYYCNNFQILYLAAKVGYFVNLMIEKLKREIYTKVGTFQ